MLPSSGSSLEPTPLSPSASPANADGPQARAPLAPARSAADQHAAILHSNATKAREGAEQRRILRGLFLLALAVLLISLLHAGFGRAFVPGWWRQW